MQPISSTRLRTQVKHDRQGAGKLIEVANPEAASGTGAEEAPTSKMAVEMILKNSLVLY
jgi:hypothetical protein